MKYSFLKQNTSDQLLLIFTGWASDERFFRELTFLDEDICVCSDYRSPEWDDSLFRHYRAIWLIAWSLGVFVADRVLQGSQLLITRAVAVNGTIYPADDERGIPVALFDGTERNLTEDNLRKFYRRMCRSNEAYKSFMQHHPDFPVPELKQVLINIRQVQQQGIPARKELFTEVIIGTLDRIFPMENQKRAWEGFPNVSIAEMAHYDEKIWKTIVEQP